MDPDRYFTSEYPSYLRNRFFSCLLLSARFSIIRIIFEKFQFANMLVFYRFSWAHFKWGFYRSLSLFVLFSDCSRLLRNSTTAFSHSSYFAYFVAGLFRLASPLYSTYYFFNSFFVHCKSTQLFSKESRMKKLIWHLVNFTQFIQFHSPQVDASSAMRHTTLYNNKPGNINMATMRRQSLSCHPPGLINLFHVIWLEYTRIIAIYCSRWSEYRSQFIFHLFASFPFPNSVWCQQFKQVLYGTEIYPMPWAIWARSM